MMNLLIGDETTGTISKVTPFDDSAFWTKNDLWYDHTFAEGDGVDLVVHSFSGMRVCVNRTNGVCEFMTETTYFDMNIPGLKTISLSPEAGHTPAFVTVDGGAPYVDVFQKEVLNITNPTVDYEWVSSNKLVIHLKDITVNDIVMLPVAYDKSFVVINDSTAVLKDIQLGMLGIDGFTGTKDIVIEYKPNYLKTIPMVYGLGLAAYLFLRYVIKRKSFL